MECVEGPDRFWERMECPGEDRYGHLKERDSLQKQLHQLGVRVRKAPRMDPPPDLELKKPAGDQTLPPERRRRRSVLCQEPG